MFTGRPVYFKKGSTLESFWVAATVFKNVYVSVVGEDIVGENELAGPKLSI